ncbi:hypothetical protein ABXT43_00795 [Candidatus Pelagibacter sp. Uisw_114]
MSPLELTLIFIFTFFQSVFGVGLLVFGTPTFLLLGYEYLDVLNILLPLSTTVSLLQIFFSKKKDTSFQD